MEKKKILIFTASTGGGHNQVALSLAKEFQLKGYEVNNLDILKETSPILDTLIADGYRILANNLPKMYGGLYRISDKKTVNKRITRLFTRLASNKIQKLIQQNNPNLIIGTHPFIIHVIGRLKEKGLITIPFISVVTDYHAHQTYVNRYVDAYITGSRYTETTLINKGIPKNRIYPYGIPVRREFLQKKSLLSKKGEERFTILLMGGSMGVKSLKRVLANLSYNKNELKIIVVCGNNETLKQNIEKRFKDSFPDKEIIVHGFTKNIPELMGISDVIISKPGGLTTTEAILMNVPMIIPFLIPGQEEENADFLVKSGAAIKVDRVKKINDVVDYLISNPESLNKMKNNMKELSNTYSIDSIIELADKLVKEYQYEWGWVYGQ